MVRTLTPRNKGTNRKRKRRTRQNLPRTFRNRKQRTKRTINKNRATSKHRQKRRNQKMNPKKPVDTLTWKKDEQYIKIETTLHRITVINKNTGKIEYTIQEISEIPSIKPKHKPKSK